MAIGLGVLRLSPAAFWTMTLREYSAVLKGMFPEQGRLGRSSLADLMQRFPDPPPLAGEEPGRGSET